MMKYDIDWYLGFGDKVKNEFIFDLTIPLALSENQRVIYDNADITYKIHRSLDICMPIILTKCVGHKIDIYRDCGANKFVILILD